MSAAGQTWAFAGSGIAAAMSSVDTNSQPNAQELAIGALNPLPGWMTARVDIPER